MRQRSISAPQSFACAPSCLQGCTAGGLKLFDRKRDDDVNWKHTDACSANAYIEARKTVGGYYLVENAIRGKSLFDVQL